MKIKCLECDWIGDSQDMKYHDTTWYDEENDVNYGYFYYICPKCDFCGEFDEFEWLDEEE